MILTFGFLAGPAKIHPEAFASVQQHRGYLSEEFQNSRMLCVSLVMLLSARQYSLECDLQKFGENDMIHGQAAFEKTETNMFISMHIAEFRTFASSSEPACGAISKHFSSKTLMFRENGPV